MSLITPTVKLPENILSFRSQALNKRIILFTNDDSAITHEKNDYNRAMSSAHDMSKNFIAFDVIQIGRYFDTNKFYKVRQTSNCCWNYNF